VRVLRAAPERAAERVARASGGAGAHWLLLAALFLAAAFVEVWETTTASKLSLDIEELRHDVRDGEAHLAVLAARASQAAERRELQTAAADLGLRPADPEQIVVIPERLVAADPAGEWPEDGFQAAQRKVVDLLVPEARARN
jgi:hypothetical protein